MSGQGTPENPPPEQDVAERVGRAEPDRRRLQRRICAALLIGGLAVWLLAGATRTVVSTYAFSGEGLFVSDGHFTSDPDSAAPGTFELVKAAAIVEDIALRLWITSGVVLAVLVLRDRLGLTRPLRRLTAALVIGGLGVWLLAGATQGIVVAYFFGESGFFAGGAFVTSAEAPAQGTYEFLQALVTVESVAFRLWITSAVILSLLALRGRLDPRLT